MTAFLSYSHKDYEIQRALVAHLAVLREKNLLSIWHDRRITPGTRWADAIDSNLATADMFLFLLSADFFDSGYCTGVEFKAAMERAEQGNAIIIPILIRPVHWKSHDLAHFAALPSDLVPVTSWQSVEEALVDVVSGIEQAIYELIENRSQSKIQKSRFRLTKGLKLLCDRDDQEAEFVHFSATMTDVRAKVPQVFIVPGDESGRHDLLIDRLYTKKILPWASRTRGIVPGVVRTRIHPVLSMPALRQLFAIELRDELFQVLGYPPEGANPGKFDCNKAISFTGGLQRCAFIVLEHSLDAGRFPADVVYEFLHWYVYQFWEGVDANFGTQVVAFVNLKYPSSRSIKFLDRLFMKLIVDPERVRFEIDVRLKRLCPERSINISVNDNGCPCTVLQELLPIRLEQVEKWVIDCRFYDGVSACKAAARRIFRHARRWGKLPSMDDLAPCLDQFMFSFGEDR